MPFYSRCYREIGECQESMLEDDLARGWRGEGERGRLEQSMRTKNENEYQCLGERWGENESLKSEWIDYKFMKWMSEIDNIYSYKFVEKCYKCSFPYKMSLII